jgi:hypothetical protein
MMVGVATRTARYSCISGPSQSTLSPDHLVIYLFGRLSNNSCVPSKIYSVCFRDLQYPVARFLSVRSGKMVDTTSRSRSSLIRLRIFEVVSVKKDCNKYNLVKDKVRMTVLCNTKEDIVKQGWLYLGKSSLVDSKLIQPPMTQRA